MHPTDPARRRLLAALASAPIAGLPNLVRADDPPLTDSVPAPAATALLKPLPGGGTLPAIGMGTWITFNVPAFGTARDERGAVLQRFFDLGGRLVDSSPMYGMSEATLGHCLERLAGAPALFSATKVWILTRLAGIGQMNRSLSLWGLPGFDLMQIHNMLDWEAHLPTLREWRSAGRIRHVGITTSHGRRHDEMLQVIEAQPDFDFVQFSYSIADREVEQRLLPAAAARGKAVIINRPFRTGELFAHVAGKPLPPWAAEIGCATWAQFFLKFVVSHPAVTVAIPATSRVDHMEDNMRALHGPMPDAAMRRRMVEWFEAV